MAVTLFSAQGDLASNAMPSDTAFQYGGGGALGGARVLLNKQNFSHASPAIPGATGADNVLAVYSVPASTFDASGRSIIIRALGTIANNANTKRVKIIFNPATAVVGSTVGAGGSTIADSGSYSTAAATGFALEAIVTKDGAAGSNTQTGVNVMNLIGATAAILLSSVAITATESAPILIAVTGNAGTTASDIGLNLLDVIARC